jgi:VanZ family protein
VPIFLSLALFGAAIELVQALPNPGREPSWMDRLADLTAAAAVLIFVGAVRLIRQAR